MKDKRADIRKFIRATIRENRSLDSAQVLSQYAHRNQKRRSGEPYFFHPQEVADIVRRYYGNDTVTYYTAMLHDALEDGIPLGNIDDESQFFDLLIDELPEEEIELADEIYAAVQLMTKQNEQSYLGYLNLLMSDIHAFRVKLADMMQNAGDNPSITQVEKYAKAKEFIADKFNGVVPAGISADHWKDFKQAIKNAKEK